MGEDGLWPIERQQGEIGDVRFEILDWSWLRRLGTGAFQHRTQRAQRFFNQRCRCMIPGSAFQARFLTPRGRSVISLRPAGLPLPDGRGWVCMFIASFAVPETRVAALLCASRIDHLIWKGAPASQSSPPGRNQSGGLLCNAPNSLRSFGGL